MLLGGETGYLAVKQTLLGNRLFMFLLDPYQTYVQSRSCKEPEVTFYLEKLGVCTSSLALSRIFNC